jgi:hypothetical protein
MIKNMGLVNIPGQMPDSILAFGKTVNSMDMGNIL